MIDQICFNKTSFYTFIVVCVAIIGYVLYTIHVQQLAKVSEGFTTELQQQQDQMQRTLNTQQEQIQHAQLFALNIQQHEDTQRMINPFVPPVKRGPLSFVGAWQTTPVNIPTRGEYGAFQQVGYLHHTKHNDQAMPLMGRRIHSRKYEYYTFHHANPNIKIPISIKGDDEVYDATTLQVPGYKGNFTVKIYDLDHPRYIPF